MIDILFAVIIVTAAFFAMRYIKNTKHCAHNCDECKHPCRTRS